MLLRTAVGAVVGTVAGLGFLTSLDMLSRYCLAAPGRRGCHAGWAMTFGPLFAFWMVVAGLLVCIGFRVWRVEREWWAAGIGGGLWFLLILAVIYVSIFDRDLVQDDMDRFLMTSYVIAPCVAYGVAALCTAWRRTT